MQGEERFRKAIKGMTGQLCWLPQHGHGSMLTLQFGDPRLQIEEPRESATTGLTRRLVTAQGEWHLFVESGVWKIMRQGAILADPLSDDEAVVDRGLNFLSGQRLKDVQVAYDSIDFVFDLDAVLRIPVSEEEEDAPFTLFERGKAVWPE
jgi:hypothetical protein